MNSRELKIFLSSTYVDLIDVREKTLKFLGVLKSDIFNMEIFGSDESQPKDYCLKKVEECNFFVGIYAERYGNIDTLSGFSITELEYHTAYKKLEAGSLHGLLLYVLHQDANWQISFVDRDSEKVQKMTEFKKLIGERHTLSFFKDETELPFNVLRDTIRKLEIGQLKYFTGRQKAPVVLKDKIDKPVGMEFFNQDLSNIFFGREVEIEKLTRQIIDFKFSLLIGVSGIGKTSLLNAGIISKFNTLRWVSCIIRPLNDPLKNLKSTLWTQLMEGPLPLEFELIDVIRTVLMTFIGKKILVIIDQFEDVLNCKSPVEIDSIISNLMQLYALDEPNLHILISYRGDVESEVGFIWQKISGAADGLPRFYLNALNKQAASLIFSETSSILNITLDDTSTVEKVIEDLNIESLSNGYSGIFPPFLQMLLVTIYEINKSAKFTFKKYNALDGCKGIIGGYLTRQLDYLGSDKDIAIKVLIALVSNYGTKTQKNIDEIASEIETHKFLSPIISKLIDLRLIRAIDNFYEITHDLLAKNILNNLVTDEELNIRKFKFLLESKADAYKNTNSDLTLNEHLFLYKYKSRLAINPLTLDFLMKSGEKNNAPICYWLTESSIQNISSDNLLWISNADDILYPFSKINHFQKKVHFELTSNIKQNVINLSRSSKKEKLDFFYSYCEKEYLTDFTLPECRALLLSSVKWEKLVGIVGVGKYGTRVDFKKLVEYLNSKDLKNEYICYKAIVSLTQRTQIDKTVKNILENYEPKHFQFLNGNQSPIVKLDLDYLIQLYNKLSTRSEKGKYILNLIKETATKKDSLLIEDFVYNQFTSTIKYESNYEDLFELALCFCQRFTFYTTIIKITRYSLTFSYYTYMHERIAYMASERDYEYVKSYINDNVINGGYEYESNDYLMTWIMSCAFSNLIKGEDKGYIIKLLKHGFWTVKNSAIRGLLKISLELDITNILNLALNDITNDGYLKALRVLDRKYYLPESLKFELNNPVYYDIFDDDDGLPF